MINLFDSGLPVNRPCMVASKNQNKSPLASLSVNDPVFLDRVIYDRYKRIDRGNPVRRFNSRIVSQEIHRVINGRLCLVPYVVKFGLTLLPQTGKMPKTGFVPYPRLRNTLS